MTVLSNNSKVARNTLILYVRMLITLLIGIWTSRIILNALGFIDNGLYNVVGGFVGFFAIITNAQSNAISRFITFEIGHGDTRNINAIYHTSLFIQFVLCAIILLLAETIGLWFVNYKLVVPANRLVAVNVVYQLSVGSFILGILSTAQNALIIAHEKMNVFAYVSIFSAVAKLIISFIIAYSPFDRLILYASLLFFVSLATRIFYVIYTPRTFPYCNYGLSGYKVYLKKMFGYAGWSFIGETAGVLRGSGISVILNLFAGPIANTVNGIANQVNGLVNMFVNDFTTAFNPQITKKYAAHEYESLILYIYRCSKFSFLLMTVMAVPIFFNVDFLLVLWLKKVPAETFIFTQLIIIMSLIESVSRPLITAKAATGNIRNYQLIVGGILILSLPLAYLFLKLGLPIYYSYIALIITSFGAFCARMLMLDGAIPLWQTKTFMTKVIFPMVMVLLLAAVLPWLLRSLTNISPYILFPISFIWTLLIVAFIGCDKPERAFIVQTVRNFIPGKK